MSFALEIIWCVYFIYCTFQVAIGAPGNAKLYPLLSGKDAFKQSLVDLFPNETEAIDKYFDILKVSLFSMF